MSTTIVTPPTAHSHSRLLAFTQCPLSYKLIYMDKMPQDSSDAMEIGSAAHEFFDRFVKGNRFYDSTEDKLFDAYLTSLAAECFQATPRSQDNFKDYLEICRTFAREYKPDPQMDYSECEVQVAFDRQWKPCDWFAKDVMFRAKIDRIDYDKKNPPKKIRIVDYKTGFAGAPDSFQLDVYALVASLIYTFLEQVEVQFYYVKSGFKQVKLLEVKDMGITKIQLEALMERIESEKKWKAKPGSRCLTCPVAAHCTEKPSNLIKIDSLDVAKTLGAEIAFLEAQAKAKKKGLNAWCKQNGAVESGGLVWNHYPTESMRVEMAPFLSACVAFQVDPAEVLNPDTRAIRKVSRQNPNFGEAIAPYTAMEVSTRFAAKKAGEDGE